MRKTITLLVAVLLCFSGCRGGRDAADRADSGPEAPMPAEAPWCQFTPPSPCADGLSVEVARETLSMVCAIDGSLQIMGVCGGLTLVIYFAVLDIASQLATDLTALKPPDDFVWQGDGTYRSETNWRVPSWLGLGPVYMDVRFYFGEDYAIGRVGDPVTHDLFAPDSYLVGARAELDVARGRVMVRYREPGPLVELLGFGPTPPNPLPLTPNDVQRITRGFERLTSDARAVVTTYSRRNFSLLLLTATPGGERISIRYTAQTPLGTLVEKLDAFTVPWEVIAVDGRRGSQTATLDDWSIASLTDMPARLGGEATLSISGGPFDYRAQFVYGESGDEILLTCP